MQTGNRTRCESNPHGGRTSAAVTGGVRVETGTCAPAKAAGWGGGVEVGVVGA